MGPDKLLSEKGPHAQLAFDVLECILEPIFEKTKLQTSGQSPALSPGEAVEFLGEIDRKREELLKYAEMLKIYLRDADDKHETIDCTGAGSQKYIC